MYMKDRGQFLFWLMLRWKCLVEEGRGGLSRCLTDDMRFFLV